MKREPDRLYLRAIEAFRHLPGVVGVGSGFKVTRGELLTIPVLRVIVRKKRPLSELPESHRVPAFFDGLAVDVCEPYAGTPAAQALEPLQGGMAMTSARGQDGTLGCFGTVGPAGQKKTVLLTAGHVLNSFDTFPAVFGPGGDIGSPDISSSWCCTTGKVATILGGVVDEEVDCGIALVGGSERPVQQLIRGLGPDKNGENVDRLAGVAPLRTDPDTQIQAPVIKGDRVKKVGKTTGLTRGVVRSVDVATGIGGDVPDVKQQIMVDPLKEPVNLRKDKRYHFTDEGDSGAVILDEEHRVAALLIRKVDHSLVGLPKPFPEAGVGALGTDINRVISTIRSLVPDQGGQAFTIFPSSSQQGTQPTDALVAGTAIHRLPNLTPEQLARRENVERAKQELGTFALGRQFVSFIVKHREEIRKLVNHHRSFTVAWHRARGPAFLALFLKELDDVETPIPSIIEGTTVESGLATVHAALAKCASPELVDDMLPLWPPLEAAMPRSPTVRALIDNLRELDAR